MSFEVYESLFPSAHITSHANLTRRNTMSVLAEFDNEPKPYHIDDDDYEKHPHETTHLF